jgi:hypothetical protein
MNYYLAKFILLDNGHEHVEYRALAAETEKDARELCDEKTYAYGEETDDSLFGYGDGDTAVTGYYLKPVPVGEYVVLSQHLGDITRVVRV